GEITACAASLPSPRGAKRSGERVTSAEGASRVRGKPGTIRSLDQGIRVARWLPLTPPSLRSGDPLPASRGEGSQAAAPYVPRLLHLPMSTAHSAARVRAHHPIGDVDVPDLGHVLRRISFE